jgi:hypothetical protein
VSHEILRYCDAGTILFVKATKYTFTCQFFDRFFFRNNSPGRKRASGGSGGMGGNVYIRGDPELFSLNFETYHFNAKDGKHGGSK